MPPKKKSNTALIITIVAVCLGLPCIGLIAVSAMGVKFFNSTLKPLAGCAMAFEDVQHAVLAYADANSGKLPKAEQWQDLVKSYYGKTRARSEKTPFDMKLTPDGLWGCDPDGDGKISTGIAFNTEVSEKKIDEITDPGNTALIYEVPTPAKNAHQPYAQRQNTGEGPVVFAGERRDWFWAPVRGEVRAEFDPEKKRKSRGDRGKGSEESKDSSATGTL